MSGKAKVGSSHQGFFAVDRRAWARVCLLSMNAAVAYLVLARGTGGDNRTSKWSAHAIEVRTGISRSRSAQAIRSLEWAGMIWRDPDSKPDHPKYKLRPAHEIKGCEGYPLRPLLPTHQRVYDAMGEGWTDLLAAGQNFSDSDQLDDLTLQQAVHTLVSCGYAERHLGGRYYRKLHYSSEAAAKPDWIWLPNSLIDGIGEEVAPVELVRQTDDLLTLQVLVELYRSHRLYEDGGIHFRHICLGYDRHKLGQRGEFTVWGFMPKKAKPVAQASLLGSFEGANEGQEQQKEALKVFAECWDRLLNLGLVEWVAHLVHSDSSQGEIIQPMALAAQAEQ
jgi:hypothetical protein